MPTLVASSAAVGAGPEPRTVDVSTDDEGWWGTVEIGGTEGVIAIEGTGASLGSAADPPPAGSREAVPRGVPASGRRP